jgi:hypothetical protein
MMNMVSQIEFLNHQKIQIKNLQLPMMKKAILHAQKYMKKLFSN